MRRLLPMLVVLVAPACVLDVASTDTRLVAACAHDVPLAFTVEGATRAVATVTVDHVGATVKDPSARVTFATIELAASGGATDFGSADALAVEVVASGLPTAVVLDTPISGASPVLEHGSDPSNLLDYLTASQVSVRVILSSTAATRVAAVASVCLDVSGIDISTP